MQGDCRGFLPLFRQLFLFRAVFKPVADEFLDRDFPKEQARKRQYCEYQAKNSRLATDSTGPGASQKRKEIFDFSHIAGIITQISERMNSERVKKVFKPLKFGNLEIMRPIFAAPLAGITDRPFRQILRKCAPDAPILTEMISSHSLIINARRGPKSNCMRNFDDYGAEGLVGAQLFGADPDIMGDAAKILEQNGASWIDINMGCPVPKVASKAGAGANLMRDHDLAGRIVKSVVGAVSVPVSIKTRLGWDDNHLDSAHLLHVAHDNGASWATVHGRTRAAGYVGAADWVKIKECAISNYQLAIKLPIIFNGDIKTGTDVDAVAALGADGVMIGRALYGNPWLLGQLTIGNDQLAISAQDRLDTILEHFDLSVAYYGPATAVPMFRKHAAWYTNGMDNATTFRVCVNQIKTVRELRALIVSFFGN